MPQIATLPLCADQWRVTVRIWLGTTGDYRGYILAFGLWKLSFCQWQLDGELIAALWQRYVVVMALLYRRHGIAIRKCLIFSTPTPKIESTEN